MILISSLALRRIPRAKAALLAAATALLLTACSQGRIIKVTPVAGTPPFTAARGTEWKEADSLWDLRAKPREAWASLIAYRRAVEEQPGVPDLWSRYARACYFVATYAEQNREWSNPERVKGVYLEGARAAETALKFHAEYARRLTENGDEAYAVGAVSDRWLEPAFWYAVNRGRWALGENRRIRADGRERLGDFVRNIAKRNDTLYYGGLHRFLGVMFLVAAEPRPDSARAHFDHAFAIAPLYLANTTLRAQYLSAAEGDSAGFRESLEYVLTIPADSLPAAAIENALERERARDLLSRRAEFFP